MKKTRSILLIIPLVLAISLSIANKSNIRFEDEVKLINELDTAYAGDDISLIFSTKTVDSSFLYIHNSYGSTLLEPDTSSSDLVFTIPLLFSRKTGILNWTLVVQGESSISGSIPILPQPEAGTDLENYLGPRQIMAGYNDFAMLVTIPTDGFDNPLEPGTNISISAQFRDTKQVVDIKTDILIAWTRIPSTEKAGSSIVASHCNGINSSQLSFDIYPNNPDNFNIGYDRLHDFADGNQQVEFFSETIKDVFGNIISDGTFVKFIIKNTQNRKLMTFGETVNGVARAKILHPEFPDNWNVQAYISGLAESNILQLEFRPSLKGFEVNFTRENRKIIIGPIISFMDQLIPDGVTVRLRIFKDKKLLRELSEYSNNGIASFYLDEEFFKGGEYDFQLETLGITKNYNGFHLK